MERSSCLNILPASDEKLQDFEYDRCSSSNFHYKEVFRNGPSYSHSVYKFQINRLSWGRGNWRHPQDPDNICWVRPNLRTVAPADNSKLHDYRRWKLSRQERFFHRCSIYKLNHCVRTSNLKRDSKINWISMS